LNTAFIHQPHDKLFKLAMKQLIVARDFFEAHLPADILKQVDLSTLQLEKATFVDDKFKETEADLVYSVDLLDNAKAYLYLLCENQSDVDNHMPFRLSGYTLQVMQDHLKKHPNEYLPVVFPLVIYTGKKLWTAPMDIFPLFGEQAALARSLHFQPYTLIDLHRMTDDELMQHDFSGLVEYVLKYRQTQEIEKLFKDTFSWLDRATKKNLQEGILLGKYVVFYITKTNEHADVETFNRLAEEHLASTTLRSEMMTLAEQFIEEGRNQAKAQAQAEVRALAEQFIEEGRNQAKTEAKAQTMALAEQFKQEGIQKGEATILNTLLTGRFGSLEPLYLKKLETASPDQLLTWVKKFLQAQSLHDVFED